MLIHGRFRLTTIIDFVRDAWQFRSRPKQSHQFANDPLAKPHTQGDHPRVRKSSAFF